MNEEKKPKALIDLFQKVIPIVENAKMDYLVIGGIAASSLGEARITEDLDLILFIKRNEVKKFLGLVKKEDFDFDERAQIENARITGCFRIHWNNIRLDLLCASTDFEREAYQRKIRLKFFQTEANFPTPENLIILKIVANRPKDIFDVESIAIRNWKKLDLTYLEKWIQKICDQSENMTYWKSLKRVLKYAKKVSG